ncbi:MAG: chemotaxis protein CheX [Terriglobales bacterium]|jgi:chemotaxis protein CheX
MSVDRSFVTRSKEENWMPVLELAVEEVFEIMVGCRVKPVAQTEHPPNEEYTAMIGLAGALCGILTLSCNAQTARQIARSMLGGTDNADTEVADALGELCNMIAGNFKNKLAGTDERCMLSVPTVISGGEYSFHSLADGCSVATVLLFEDAPVAVRLQLQS